MKKTLLCLLASLALFSTVSAQHYERNIIGIRAGLDMSKVSMKVNDGTMRLAPLRTSFHIGVTDQLLLVRDTPLYLEAGLMLHNKGFSSNQDKLRLMYLQIPVMLNYHFDLGFGFKAIPFVGFYYGLGVHGKMIQKTEIGELKTDVFGSDRALSRSDFGARIGVGFSYRNFYLGVGYEGGFVNFRHNDVDGIMMRNRTWTLSVGYNF
ncbi:MAG TPA: porin family protein [Candidatus Alistipes avicola]|uniref:Porin family protein n=1 Tax=Candidatus Alistipes avicola TaxID=2838432 RepID=A0A9D2L346_9BACT|nr:outer membrane beta-barrel protein [uncultured Alistipes sp.]HJA98138.1 porin family protein [Candidatus Alistipes avicola]